MNHPLIDRIWRVCVTLSPVVALTITVLAGRRW
jgi:hypothetical protein